MEHVATLALWWPMAARVLAGVHAFTPTLMATAMVIKEKVIEMTLEEIFLENEKPEWIMSGVPLFVVPTKVLA